ncbi:MAG TPA: hypothetical protein DD662_04570 [Planctomycetaceae bacterium]|nr:hypothetical protein [Planctomycetaceae bacterium]
MITAARRRLAAFFDCLHESAKRDLLDTCVVSLAAAGFLGHLLLVAVVNMLPEFPQTIFEGLDRSLLHAVYTPFSIILFYEVILLVFALADSHTGEVAKQYQIVSLIVVRRVFKDIGSFESFEHWLTETEAVKAVLTDMGGAVLMFVLVTIFTLLRRIIPKVAIQRDLVGFIELKKAVAVLLLVVLSGLALLNLAVWLRVLPVSLLGLTQIPENVDLFFFPLFFEFMIFTDVFILIVSLAYYDRYEYVFRNAGFVISTVLLRVSLSTPKPYDIGVALIAMAYGVCVLAVFGWFSSIVNGQKLSDDSNNRER